MFPRNCHKDPQTFIEHQETLERVRNEVSECHQLIQAHLRDFSQFEDNHHRKISNWMSRLRHLKDEIKAKSARLAEKIKHRDNLCLEINSSTRGMVNDIDSRLQAFDKYQVALLYEARKRELAFYFQELKALVKKGTTTTTSYHQMTTIKLEIEQLRSAALLECKSEMVSDGHQGLDTTDESQSMSHQQPEVSVQSDFENSDPESAEFSTEEMKVDVPELDGSDTEMKSPTVSDHVRKLDELSRQRPEGSSLLEEEDSVSQKQDHRPRNTVLDRVPASMVKKLEQVYRPREEAKATIVDTICRILPKSMTKRKHKSAK